MADLLIRDLAPATHQELKRRASDAGMSLQAYVSDVLGRHAQLPSLDEWLAQLDELPRHPGVSGSDAVRDARAELL